MTDGTYVGKKGGGGGRCLLVLIDGRTGMVVRIRWCAHETIADYRALFHGVPAPDVLVSDGMRGMETAAKAEWPGVRLQRCLVHVQRNTKADLTGNPRGQAGKELKRLASKLTKVKTAEQAAKWGEALNAWYQRWKALVNQRTKAADDPTNTKALNGRAWWWTHERLRRAYKRLERLFRDGSLFAYTEPALLEGGPVPATTNRLEGGVNSPIKHMLANHRGMPLEHVERACEWNCYMRSEHPDLGALLDTYLTELQTDMEGDLARKEADTRTTGDEPTPGTMAEYTDLHTSGHYSSQD